MPSYDTSPQTTYVSPGMPPLILGKTTSFFEFWPTWLMYLPVGIQWILLSIRYQSFTLPLIANPKIPLSGMVGIPKSSLLNQATHELKECILPWFTVERTKETIEEQWPEIEHHLDSMGLSFPCVCKPDIGCRGAGVKLAKNKRALLQAFNRYPTGSKMMIQKLADFEPEAGIFFTRRPGNSTGTITSMALKYMPYVTGDGHSTLAELIHKDTRAGALSHLYQRRHAEQWHDIVPAGQPFRLVFSASHSKGAIFKDARQLISPPLSKAINALMLQLPDFHYGRLDVKFKSIEDLQLGKHIQIIEINTASSESLHIWDSNTGFRAAVGSLLSQYKTLFEIGAINRSKGYQPPSFKLLLQHWRLEQKLTKFYPETD